VSRRCVGVSVALALVACRPAPAQLTGEQAHAIVDSVAAAFSDYVARLNARDVDSVMRFYLSDSAFVWLEDGAVRYRSPAEIRPALDRLKSYRNVRFSFDAPLIVAQGPGAATINSTFDQSLVDSAGGGFALVGAISVAARHTPAGWKWATGHTSVRREAR